MTTTTLGMALAALLCLQGCNSRCPETVEDVCREQDCPESPRDALEAPCRYPQVFSQGTRFVIGIVDGYGAVEYHFSGKELVGFRTRTDTFAERDECPLSFNVGEDVLDSRRLEHLDGDSCLETAEEGCIESCTFCPDLEEALGRCSEGIFDSL